MEVKVLTGPVTVPAGLCRPYRRTLSQPVIYDTRERTEQKELRLSIRKRSGKGVWRKQLSVGATTLNSLHPTQEYNLLPLSDTPDHA